jgi:hypothetical protein
MLAIMVAAAVGAVAGSLATASLKWGRSALAWVVAKIRRDHLTLYGGRAWSLPQSVSASVPCSVRVLIACAPSRALRQSDIDPDLAIPFIRESFPGVFPHEPVFSMPADGVRFSAGSDGSSVGGYAWAWAAGRVDLAVDVDLERGPDDRSNIPLLDVLRPIALMAAAVSGPTYAKVYGNPRSRLPRRFDWFIAVSTDFIQPAGGTVPWSDIAFPGRRPPRAGSDQRTFCPLGGYASAKLRSWKAGGSSADLISIFLEDFLKQNGYHDVADAVADAVGAAANALEASTRIGTDALEPAKAGEQGSAAPAS